MRFVRESEAGALRAHLEKELEGPVTPDLFIEPKSAIVVPGQVHQAAVESGNVTADVVENSEFPDLATGYHVRGVPKIVMNDTVELVGAQPEAAFVDAMLRAAA